MPQEQRRLGAIVAADVVGYSRLIGRDESGTVSRVRQNRAERLDPVLARHGGRLVKLTGDGALIEFASAVEALNASIEFQQSMAEANWGVPPESALLFRVGLHLGDLIVDGDDLYGDGVNVAARLEGAAPPGGIVISGTVHESVAGRVKAALEDLGQLELKNIERPVHAYLVKWDPQDWKEVAAAPPVQPRVEGSQSPGGPFSLPDKPSPWPRHLHLPTPELRPALWIANLGVGRYRKMTCKRRRGWHARQSSWIEPIRGCFLPPVMRSHS